MYKFVISRKRMWCIFILFFIMFALLFLRLFQYQYLNSKKYSAMAEAQYSYSENTEDFNFKLLDRNGNDLSQYKDNYYAVIVPSAFKSKLNTDTEAIMNMTYALRNYDDSYDLSNIDILKDNPKLYWEIDAQTFKYVKALKQIQGVYVFQCKELQKRGTWNVESILLNPRRTVDNSLKSDDSIEIQIYNRVKNNKYPKVVIERDVSGNITGESSILPDDNVNVKLTLDKTIQSRMDNVLKSEKYKKYKQLGAVMMESSSGKILGMVQKDDSQPNVNMGAATDGGFYPGSIFKIIVEEAALGSNSIELSDKFTCRGYYEDAHKNHGTLTSHEAMVVSCNDIYAQIGNKTGYKAFYSMAEKQGLFSKVIGFDSELSGEVDVAQPVISNGSISIAAMGQGIRITPLEALSISNTVANGGIYVKPYLVDSYIDNNSKVTETNSTIKSRVFDSYIADEIKSQMQDVVETGTARGTQINGIEIGGKTGTTQRNNLSDGWFAGYFNIDGKNYSMVVFAENIDKVTESGGSTAAPIFKDIVENTEDILK